MIHARAVGIVSWLARCKAGTPGSKRRGVEAAEANERPEAGGGFSGRSLIARQELTNASAGRGRFSAFQTGVSRRSIASLHRLMLPCSFAVRP